MFTTLHSLIFGLSFGLMSSAHVFLLFPFSGHVCACLVVML